jgi:hypothetical protein
MNVSAIAPSDSSQRYANLNALQSALQSGSITNAQHAFAAFEQEVQKASATGSAGLFAKGTQPSNDLKQLGDALKSADLAGAQHAFVNLKHDVQSSGELSARGSSHGVAGKAHTQLANAASKAGSILNLRA